MDGKLIAQVIINLLENAVRHTPPDGTITLTVRAGEKLSVSVADTGGGVPAAIRGHLFEGFVTRDEKVVDGRRGLGLGLAICKAIVEAHGGEIRMEDNVPKGAVFIFTLPVEESE
jgi:two-component system sensor histidine kinase KdpD